METLMNRLETIDWQAISNSLNAKGYAIAKDLMTTTDCDELIRNYSNDSYYRKTISMERYRFGAGEYKYFNYPLPTVVQSLREYVYNKLAPIANQWMEALHIETRYPGDFADFQKLCHAKMQRQATALILKYGPGGHNTLHQDLYGAIYFPMQLVIFLSDPNSDYTGGEFVLIQQQPRAQSKAIVLTPRKGDLLIFSTNFRPVKGTKGYYRVNMKHGVSELHTGNRYTLGVIFHDATN